MCNAQCAVCDADCAKSHLLPPLRLTAFGTSPKGEASKNGLKTVKFAHSGE